MKKLSLVLFCILVISVGILFSSCGKADEEAMTTIDELLAEIPDEEIVIDVGVHDISEEVALVKAEAEKIGAEYTISITDKEGNAIEFSEETFTVEYGENYTVVLNITLNKVVRNKTILFRAAENFTVTFDVNGGQETGNVSYEQIVVEGYNAILPSNPTRVNYIFGGWSPDPILDDVAANSTYEAIWRETYLITFIPNGGSALSSIRVSQGDTTPIPISAREGYYFDAWYTDSNLTTPFSIATISEDMSIYAKWILHLGTPSYNGVVIPEQGQPNTYLMEYPASSGELNMELLTVGSPSEYEFTYIPGLLPDMSSGYGEVGITVMNGETNMGAILVIFQAVSE